MRKFLLHYLHIKIIQGFLSQTWYPVYFYTKRLKEFHELRRLIIWGTYIFGLNEQIPQSWIERRSWVILHLKGLGTLFTTVNVEHNFDEPFLPKKINKNYNSTFPQVREKSLIGMVLYIVKMAPNIQGSILHFFLAN